MGDHVIVGISTDEVIRKAKGEGRPIIPQDKRVQIISAISGVDEVVVGGKINFVDFILRRKPDIYLKGGDYTLETINQNERRAVESYGGKIMFTDYIKDASTTRIVKEIKDGR